MILLAHLHRIRRQPALLTKQPTLVYYLSMRIVGVDPGETSGTALVIDGKVIGSREAKSLSFLFALLGILRPDILVVENFILGFRYRKKNAEGPFKAIGICELYAEINHIKIVRSNPSKLQGKAKPRGMSPHIWSAQVHALGYQP